MYVGIDVSKDKLDVAWFEGDHVEQHVCHNDRVGFEALLKFLPPQAHLIMEATGPYYLGLALYMHEQGIDQSVVNPLVVKHFARMRMQRAKTDAVDARLLAEFGTYEQPPCWQPPSEQTMHLQQLNATLEHYVKERTRITNQREAFEHAGRTNKTVLASLKRMYRQVEKEITRLQKEIESIIDSHHGDLYERLKTIPGIGPKTGMLLILITDGFTRFEHVKQLVAYVGLAPRLSSSGRRLQGRASICKLGMSRMRACLYMAARSAAHHNPACKALYERLRGAGKAHRVALIAVAHKLLRQAFAIGTKGGTYNLNKSMNIIA